MQQLLYKFQEDIQVCLYTGKDKKLKMVIPQPVPHTISIRMVDDEILKDVKLWEIQTPPENGLIWAILMSYIFSLSSSKIRLQRYQQLLVLKKDNEQYQYPDGLEQNLENKNFTINQFTKTFVKGVDLLRETITNLPEIKNEFFARKLRNYLTIATKNNSEINILCLERIIQVLGEIMCSSNESGCIFKHFLQSCLPEGLEKSLCELRNHCFSKYRANCVQGRIDLEKQRNKYLGHLFEEIRDLFFILKPTTENYFLRLNELLIKRGKEKSIDGYIEIFQHFHRFQEHTLLHREKYFIGNKKDFAIISNNLLQFIYERLSISELKKMSESLELESEDFLTLNKLDTYFRSLIYITEYISESNRNSDPHLINCCRRMNTAIDILGTKPIFEVRNKILDILNDFKQMYSKIFDEFDKLNRYEGLSLPKRNYLSNLNYFIFRCIHSEDSLGKEINEFMLAFHSNVFKFDELEIKNILEPFEIYVNFWYNLNPHKHESKVNVLEGLKLVLKEKFKKQSNGNGQELNFTLLKNLTKTLKDFNIFSAKESIQLKQNISDLLFESNRKFKEARNIFKALSTIEDSSMSEEEFEDLLKSVILPHKTRKKVFEHILQSGFKSALTCLEFEPVLKIKDIKDNLELNVTKQLMELFKKEKYRTIFLKMDLEPEIKRKVCYIMNQKIYFLINRIKKFERILINSQENVRYLWLKRDNEAIKQHIKILMCERFLNERETRVSLEMLLFDCLNILKDKKLQELWEKTINMFNGINLRDFLSHGSPVVELVVNFLEPEDLPMTFIQKILELISDKEVLISLCELWISVKPCTLQELEAILESDAEDEYSNSRKSIKSCPRWKNYFKLLPLEIFHDEWDMGLLRGPGAQLLLNKIYGFSISLTQAFPLRKDAFDPATDEMFIVGGWDGHFKELINALSIEDTFLIDAFKAYPNLMRYLSISEHEPDSEEIVEKDVSDIVSSVVISPVFEINGSALSHIKENLMDYLDFQEGMQRKYAWRCGEKFPDHYPKFKKDFVNKIINILEDTFLKKKILNGCRLKFENLNNLLKQIKEYDFFSKEEKLELKQKVESYVFVKSNEVVNRLRSCNGVEDDLLKDVYTSQKTKKKVLDFLRVPKQEKAEEISDGVYTEIHKIDFEVNAYQKLISLFHNKQHYREMFLKMDLSQKLRNKVLITMNQKIYFLINRIDELEKIIIDGDEEVKALLLSCKNDAVKDQVKSLMCERYFNDVKTETTLEILFFDCLNVLYNSNELKSIWGKTSDLFAGLNLRHFMAHGVAEIAFGSLDPEDIKLEIISKILKLIGDKPVLESLTKLWIKTKFCKYKELEALLERKEEDEYSNLRKEIINCDSGKIT
ncbi:uncharacterized protein [Parasteatoda tepidariorum]|uniref:uncharacterized protein n=1 Tax=Parasteatoda tepidariorum TaxID=114398 RepID=UPI0039BCD591